MPQSLDNLPDEELMALYQSGEPGAFAVLYSRHSGRVFGFLGQKTSPETARELLQEAFLKVHRSRHQYQAQYPFLPWLFAITRNALLDHLRRKEQKVAGKAVEEVDVAAPEPEEAPDLGETLRHLPAHQRRAVELRYLNDWSFEQIAAELDTSAGNARQLVSRALRSLRGRGGLRE